jgi:hypothetical protein
MIDYLLKFPSKKVAEAFGVANGFAKVDEKSGETISQLASHAHALIEIGDHNKDEKYWVLFRDLVDMPVPNGGEQFIFWASNMTITDDIGSIIEVPRPEFNPAVPSLFWADGSIPINNDPPLPITKEKKYRIEEILKAKSKSL